MAKTYTKCALAVLAAVSVTVSAGHTETLPETEPVRDISIMEVDKKTLNDAIASRTLTWLTGSSSNNDYVSVGRLANFFGFVALRVSSGHSLSRSSVAKETLHVLSKTQQAALISLVEEQKDAFSDVQTARFEMNRALEGLLVGEDISESEFTKLGETYGEAEARLGHVIAQRLGAVSTSLSDTQKSKLRDIRSKYVSGKAGAAKIKGIKTKLSEDDKKELINLGAKLLSWTTGTSDLNDFEVVGKPSQHFGFVSLRIESNHGVKRGDVAKDVLDLLTPEQAGVLQSAADQNVALFETFMDNRRRLMRTFEVALSGKSIDSQKVKTYGQAMGQFEAEMTWAQAMAMLNVRHSMSEDQLISLLDLRSRYTGKGETKPSDPVARGRQLYAQCVMCHDDNGPSIGPNISNIFGKKVAGDPAFSNYSTAFKMFSESNEIWDENLLDRFLESPTTTVPGTYMGYKGLDAIDDRDAIIEFLSQPTD